jgi:AcrR family transcriptional regulator
MQKSDKFTKKVEHILKSAIEAYQKYGVTETTVKQIAQTAGVGKGTIYKHFRSKEDILVKASEYYNDRLKEELAFLAEFAEKEPVQALDSYIEKTIQATINNPQELLFRIQLVSEAIFLNQQNKESSANKYKELTEPMINIYLKIIKAGIENGAIKPKVNKKELPVVIDSLIRGISVLAFMKDKEEINRIGNSIKRTVFGLLGISLG